jgi:hypothetical protein
MNNRWDKLGWSYSHLHGASNLALAQLFFRLMIPYFVTLHRFFHFVRPSMMFARESRL